MFQESRSFLLNEKLLFCDIISDKNLSFPKVQLFLYLNKLFDFKNCIDKITGRGFMMREAKQSVMVFRKPYDKLL